MDVENNARRTPRLSGRGLVRVRVMARVRTTVRTRVMVRAVPWAATCIK